MNLARVACLTAFVLAGSISITSTAGPSEDADAAFTNGDYATALRLSRELAEQGEAFAQSRLGVMYRDGRGVLRDDQQAVEWFRKAAEQGRANAQDNLGGMYETGRGVAKDEAEAVKWYRKAAEQGNAIGQAKLGYMYETGGGVTKDETQAAEWYRKAAEQGNTAAQINLGTLYRDGRGVSQDDAEAIKWYRKAAEQGNPIAQVNLGGMYRDGRGVAKDDAAAVTWFRKGAEQGNAFGQASLGYMYETGRGVAKDETQAVDWYRKAAEQGNPIAQINLGTMYETGRGGLPMDDTQAVEWYRKAAEQGSTIGQSRLGAMYHEGRGGLPQDDKQAVEWYRKAAAQGDTNAKNVLASIEQRGREDADLSRTAAELVKANEKDLPATPVADAERAALVHEITEATHTREILSNMPAEIKEGWDPANPASKLPPKLVDALRATALATFQPDPILNSFEHKLAETLDAATLLIGLQWERSDLGQHMTRLQVEAQRPEQRAVHKEFARQFVSKGGMVNDARARACAQADVLGNNTEVMLPFLEAVATGGIMAALTQQGRPLDMKEIERAIVTMRPLLRESARQGALEGCLFQSRELTDTELEQWVEFLRSDAGGRYARGVNAAMRDAMLARAEIFTRVMLEMARQLKGRAES